MKPIRTFRQIFETGIHIFEGLVDLFLDGLIARELS